MKKYKLTGKVTISVYTEVEAETAEEAIEKSMERDIISDDGGFESLEDIYWTSSEYDGEVHDINLI